MRRWARALPLILIGVLAAMVTVTTTTPAPAAAGAARVARAALPSVAARASDTVLEVLPVGAIGSQLDVVADPGASVRRAFVVTNRSPNLRLTVRLAAVDASVRAGKVAFAHDASTGGPGSWLTFSDVVTTLEPGAHVEVSLKVELPANAVPGDVMAGVAARVDRAARVSDNAAAAVEAAVDLPVSIKVKGAPTALVSITRVRVEDDDERNVLAITFQNGGGTANVMAGRVRVSGPEPRTIPVQVTVAPLQSTIVKVPFTMPAGAKTVPVSVSAKNDQGDEATWSGKVGSTPPPPPATASPRNPAPASPETPADSSGDASVPPAGLAVVALVFGAAAIWFAAEIRRSRARRRAVAVARPVPVAASAAVVPVATGDLGPLGAVATQLAALVESIDRLVGRLGEQGAAPVATAPVATTAPAPAAPPAPAASVPTTPVSESIEPLFYAPAANGVPGEDVDPFDWPTPAQLDQFVARRRAEQSDQ